MHLMRCLTFSWPTMICCCLLSICLLKKMLQLMRYPGITSLFSPTGSSGISPSVPSSSRTDPGTGHTSPRLDIRKLKELVQFYFTKRLDSFTQRTYKSAHASFRLFKIGDIGKHSPFSVHFSASTHLMPFITCLGVAIPHLCFFMFLRSGEMTVPDDDSYDPSAHLSVQDIAVDDSLNPSILCIRIKQSKTNPFCTGVDLFVGKTSLLLCPVSAMLSYLCARGMELGPLFRFQDGKLLTRQRFVEAVKEGLAKAGIDAKKYSCHSFRIGAAAAKGIEDSITKTLRRWESLAYLQYVKIPRSQLAGYSCTSVSYRWC